MKKVSIHKTINGTECVVVDPNYETNIGAEYDPASTYRAGDFVKYNDVLYKCIAEISTPESWNEANWVQVTITEAFSSVTRQTETVMEEIQQNVSTLQEDIDTLKEDVQKVIDEDLPALQEDLSTLNNNVEEFQEETNGAIETVGQRVNDLKNSFDEHTDDYYDNSLDNLNSFASRAQSLLPFNLLHNSDFTQWVVQSGTISSSHGTSKTYAGDRWILVDGTVTGSRNSNGNGYSTITLNGTIQQYVENPPATGSPFVEMVSGEATITYIDGVVTITSSGGVLKNAGLYDGTHESVPLYLSRGYAAELIECNRFFLPYVSKVSGLCVNNNTTNSAICYGGVQLPITMRVCPTATNISLGNMRVAGKSCAVSSVATTDMSGVTLSINITFAYADGGHGHVGIWLGSCALNADLEP